MRAFRRQTHTGRQTEERHTHRERERVAALVGAPLFPFFLSSQDPAPPGVERRGPPSLVAINNLYDTTTSTRAVQCGSATRSFIDSIVQ